MSNFVHLHNHSHYSLQDAACTVDSLINKAVEFEQPALALTDHGVMYGAAEFYKKAKKNGIKPIIGSEVYVVAEGTRFDRGEKNTGRGRAKLYNHLVLLAKNQIGYQNLTKLVSIGFTEGFYYKPRIDLEVLEKYKDGLIALSACLGGIVARPLLNGEQDKARETALKYKELFGDDFYLEIQDHNMDGDEVFRKDIPNLAKELDIKLVATNDIHYADKEHAIAHNILLLLQEKGDVDYKKLRYNTDEIYFKSSEEMIELFKDYDGAVENTLEIANKIDADDITFGGLHFPEFPIPEDSPATNLEEYLELLAKEGLEERYKDKEITQEVWDRFHFEINVINEMGYPGYFLITQDFINKAKDMGIPVGPGRGSAAGSLVAYALKITNVDPLEYDLLFERFLNPARQSMPDIDIDFADDQRGEVIEYCKEKYGADAVCQIVTFNTLSSKAVLKDVARVLGIPIPQVTDITKHIPSKFGKVYSIEKSIKEVPELKWLKDTKDEKIKDLIKYSQVLEGMNRNNSKHAAGVVIAPGPVSDYVALATAGSSKDLVTQFNMKELEASAGLLKMDFLGLRTLSIIRDTLTLVKKTRGIEIDIDEIPVDDKLTFDLFSMGRTTAIFQFESAPMRDYLKKLHPTSITDLSAMNALYRPGPMEFIDDFIDRKHGRKEIEYLHPMLEPILKETNGIIVYQEQVIQLANQIGGMSLAEADILRRAMGKKDLAAMAEQKKKFIAGAVKNGVSEKIADDIFVAVDKFANYGFNKSHAVAYSFVAYQTAYLKAHFLPEFLAANLTNEFGNTEKVTLLLDDCRKLKVKVLPPNINKPSVYFNVEDSTVIFGMCAIRNVGINAVKEIERARNEHGKDFESIFELCSLIDTRLVNKRALEGLVLAGAFDKLKGTRSQNFESIESAISFGNKVRGVKASSENSLFGNDSEAMEIVEPEFYNAPQWEARDRLAREREVLGFYLTDHPLRKYVMEYNSFATVHLGEQETYEDGDMVRSCGVITSVRTKLDRSGREMAFFKIDDFSGSCECLMFSKIYKECGHHIEMENTVLVKGKLESSGDEVKIHVEEVIPLAESTELLTKKIIFYMHSDSNDKSTVEKLNDILLKYSGNIPVYIRVVDNGIKRDFIIDRGVKMCDEFLKDSVSLLGDNNIKFTSQ